MKKFSFFLSLALISVLLTFMSCSESYDDSSLKDSITSLENRVTTLEDVCDDLNVEVEALQTIVDALQNRDYVTGITTISEDGQEVGYTISFSQNGSITIYNGEDGVSGSTTPVIGVMEDIDGVLYWTIDQGDGTVEWMLDSVGNKIPTTGESGYTPVIGVAEYEGETYWTIDGEFILDESGSMVATTGADGSSSTSSSMFKSVIAYDTYVEFILYSGYAIEVPLLADFIYIQGYDNGIIEYDLSNSNLILDFVCDINICTSISARVSNDIYVSTDVYTKGAATETNWGVTVDATNKTITLVAPEDAEDGDTALFELIAVNTSGVSKTIVAAIKVTGIDSGIPSPDRNLPKPDVGGDDINTNIPSASFEPDSENPIILNISMTGIASLNGDGFLSLYGTGDTNQNVWLEVDGELIGFIVINGSDIAVSGQTKADLVFVVDNSGSMSQEANTVAEQIVSWSEELSAVMDIKFGCVGYNSGVTGAIDLTDVSTISTYLDRTTGTYRTVGYADNISSTVQSAASSFYNSGECGALAIKYADEYFSFRTGANRIYVNLTDEPNQFSSSHYEWSVEAFNENATSPYSYSWSNSQGTIHTVMSDGGYSSYSTYAERPWYMSDYTGGTSMINVDSSYTGVSLSDLPVTGAILNSFLFKVQLTDGLTDGTHVLTITIDDPTTGIIARQDVNIAVI